MANPMDKWLDEEDFHTLHHIALGCRLLCDLNTDQGRGVVNGCMGTVVGIHFSNGTKTTSANPCLPPPSERHVKNIVVHLDHTHEDYKFSRTDTQSKHHDGKQYVKRTFPLNPAYALTGHRCQGATLTGPVIVHVTELFTPGILYVILSRVTHRVNLKIVGHLFASMFVPVPLNL